MAVSRVQVPKVRAERAVTWEDGFSGALLAEFGSML